MSTKPHTAIPPGYAWRTVGPVTESNFPPNTNYSHHFIRIVEQGNEFLIEMFIGDKEVFSETLSKSSIGSLSEAKKYAAKQYEKLHWTYSNEKPVPVIPTPTPDKWFLHEDRMARTIIMRDISEVAALITRLLFIIDKHPELRISMLTSDLSTRPSVAVIVGLTKGTISEEAAAFAQKINDILE